MGRRWLLAGLAWLVTAVLTTAVAIGAVNSLRQGLFGPKDEPLSEADVSAHLTSPPAATSPAPTSPAPTSPAPTAAPPSAPPSATPSTAATRALPTNGGTIVAACENGLVRLLSWTPRTGYEADHVVQGPAQTASLRFKARSGGDAVRARVTCPAGVPELSFAADD
ncbi:hypothetical protein GCM10010399_20650 [Dactylosporangium fulvum]|uniref:Septum formation initiator n=1 Tax=Dactylosporangium fulvum TaxID=53359 RepID=A0ABY5W5Z0_9ACTN|nr:hypothetical protein [Dactylosporangium fulvum]UWP84756.1 hypothetical protein Dfulv_11215 [Dactylosporangium fulvum]